MYVVKHASGYISFETTTGSDVDAHVSWCELVDAATTANPKVLNVKRTTAGETTLITGVGSTTAQGCLALTFTNVDAALSGDVIVYHHDGATKNILKRATLTPNQTLSYEDQGGWTLPATSAYTSLVNVLRLNTQHDNSTTTPTEVTDLTMPLVAGTYMVQYNLIYQAAAATTGLRISANYDSTTTRFVQWLRYVDTSATAATAVPDQDAVGAAAQVMGAFAARVGSVAGLGTTLSVDTQAADMFFILECHTIVTGAGNLELWHGSEVAFQSSLMVGSSVMVIRTG